GTELPSTIGLQPGKDPEDSLAAAVYRHIQGRQKSVDGSGHGIAWCVDPGIFRQFNSRPIRTHGRTAFLNILDRHVSGTLAHRCFDQLDVAIRRHFSSYDLVGESTFRQPYHDWDCGVHAVKDDLAVFATHPTNGVIHHCRSYVRKQLTLTIGDAQNESSPTIIDTLEREIPRRRFGSTELNVLLQPFETFLLDDEVYVTGRTLGGRSEHRRCRAAHS